MSITQIQADLDAARQGNRITLAGPVSPGLADVLARLGLTTMAVDGVAITLVATAVIVTGSAIFRGQTWQLRLTGEADGAQNRYALQLSLSGTLLRMSDLFGTLPQSRRADDSGALILMDSVIDPLQVVDASFIVSAGSDATAPVQFQGWLQLTNYIERNDIERYALFLGTDRLWLDGTVDFRPAPPALALTAMAPRARSDMPIAQINRIGLRLSTTAVDMWAVADNAAPVSLIEMLANVPVGKATPAVYIDVTTPLFMNDTLWPLTARFPDYGQSLTGGIDQIISLFGGGDNFQVYDGLLSRPIGFEALDNFYLAEIEVGINPALDGDLPSPSVDYLAITLQSRRPWNPPLPFIQVKNVGTRWLITWKDASAIVTGSVWGTLSFGKDAALRADGRHRPALGPPQEQDKSQLQGATWDLDVVAELPQFDILVTSAGSVEIPFPDAFANFFDTPSGVTASLTVSEIEIFASPSAKIFNGYLLVEGNWPVDINNITFNLDSIAFAVNVTENSVYGSLEGRASVVVRQDGVVDQTKAVFFVNAEYTEGGSWIFSGGLAEGTLDLINFVIGFLGLPAAPKWVPSIILDQLLLTYDTNKSDGNPYSAAGHLTWVIDDDALGFKLTVEADASIARVAAAQATPDERTAALHFHKWDNNGMISSGTLRGSFTINRIKISAGLSFISATKIYFFRVEWNGAAIEATTLQITTPQPPHTGLRIALQGLTLGSVVESLVNLVNPNLNYHLDAPWDFLNAIDLSRFALILDPKENTVELTFRVDLEAGFMRVDSVGLVYDRSQGEGTVRFKLVGRLLNKDYSNDAPLEWDAVNDPAPAVPGSGVQLIDLRYLGLGQHVALATMPDTIATIISRLREDMRPPKGVDSNPLDGATGLRFATDSQWLIALDMSLMNTVSLSLVFNDPQLYGLLISLGGEKSGSLAGLSFELLYKKISDDIGVFQIRLQVPDAFRQFDFGAVSITLGIISVDIFTNGNFMVDLGFPYNRVYETSFGMSAGPFIGRGGLYFGLLDGATSRRVPVVTNGHFSPVVELGVGLAVGLGRTFNKGPLKASLYVEMEVIFQGVLGWFHPNDAAADTSMYYWCRGTAAIAGKLYGKVDFKIISASISLEAYASVILTIEYHMPTEVDFDVGVEVDAEVEFLFFSVSFSFSMQLHASFTIGSASTPPWILAADQSGKDPRRLIASIASVAVPRRRRRHADLVKLTRAMFLDSRDDPALQWNPDQTLFPNLLPRTVDLKLMPVFSVDAVPLTWSGEPPVNDAPAYRVAFVLMAAAPATHQAGKADPTFNTLVEAMLRWSISALGQPGYGGSITTGALAELAAQMDSPQTAQKGFALDILDRLFDKNLRLSIRARPTTITAAGGVCFPMIPFLSWSSTDLPDSTERSRDFLSYQMIDAAYETVLKDYFAKTEAALPAEAEADMTLASESMASFVFRDYFLLIAKSVIQRAADLMAAWPLIPASGASLATIAKGFDTVSRPYVKVSGDTIDQVALGFGYSAAELEFLKQGITQELNSTPIGGSVNIVLGVTPQGLAAANPDTPLNQMTINIGALNYQLRASDTLGSIATAFAYPLAAWLSDLALQSQLRLLVAGSALSLPATYQYSNPGNLTVDTLAAVYFVRLNGYQDVALLNWYAQAIASLNPSAFKEQADGTAAPLPAQVLVPSAYDNITAPLTWNTLPGDTLYEIAATFALLQSLNPAPAFVAFRAALRIANPGPALAPIVLPAGSTTQIAPNETLGALADRLLVEPAGAAFIATVQDAAILAPLQSVAVLQAQISIGDCQTFAQVGQHYAISIDELGGRLAEQSGLLKLEADASPLNVPHMVSIKVESLVDMVLSGTTPAEISGQVSRFMLHGLRMPAPVSEHGVYPLKGLYELIGQQVTGLAPSSACDAATTRFTVNFQLPETTSQEWIELGPPPLSPAPQELAIAVTDADLCDYTPATVLTPEFNTQPAPLQLWREQNLRWALQHRILWQTPVAPPLTLAPGKKPPVNGMPSLWPLPEELLARAATETATPYVLRTQDPQLGPTASSRPIDSWGWACLIDLRLRNVPGQPNTYEMFGADTAGRNDLLAAWRYIKENQSDKPTLNFLYQPEPSLNLPTGLATQQWDQTGTYLVKTNLSTETRSGQLRRGRMADEPPDQGLFFADLNSPGTFLTLLWECSVIGGGGYWLHVTDSKGQGLPDALFGEDGNATVSILMTLSSQTTYTTSAEPARRLWSFNNCALIVDNLDPSAFHLFAEAGDGSEKVRQATVEPGYVGFDFTLCQPPPPDTVHPRIDGLPRLRRYYQLLGYRLLQTAVVNGSYAAMPVGPQAPQQIPGMAATNGNVWRMTQVLPVARLALEHPLPEVTGLPLPGSDPYAGIAWLTQDGPGHLGSARVQLWFQDMLGNATNGAPADAYAIAAAPAVVAPDEIDLPLGYTDPLIGIANWPGVSSAFRVAAPATGPGAVLEVALAFQTASCMPGAGQTGKMAAKVSTDLLSRYQRIYFQVMQQDIEVVLLTTLAKAPAPASAPQDLTTQREPLRALAAATCVYLECTASLVSVNVDRSVCNTLDAVVDLYGVGYDDIAAANADLALSAILARPSSGFLLSIPKFAVFSAGDRAELLSPLDPVGLLSANENIQLPLRTGIELHCPDRPRRTPAATTTTIAALALLENCSIASFILANATQANLLRNGMVFDIDGISVTVGAAVATLDDVARTFRDHGIQVDPLMVGARYAEVAGVLALDASYIINRYTVRPLETLQKNQTGNSVDELAKCNQATADIFYAGSAVFLSSQDGSAAFDNTIGVAAMTYGITARQLLAHNSTAPLSASCGLVVPGRAQLAKMPLEVRIPYCCSAADTLALLAARFVALDGSNPALALAAANANLPDLIAAGKTVQIGAQSVLTSPGDSLEMVANRFTPAVTMEQLVAAIGAVPGYLAPGALLLCPPALVQAASTATMAAVSATFGVDPVAIACANAGMGELIAPNKTLTLIRDGVATPISTGTASGSSTQYTLNSLVRLFAAKNVEATIAEIVTANLNVDFLAVNATLLLPPARTTLSAAFGLSGWLFPNVIFPIHTWLDLRREPNLVLPDFRRTADPAGATEACRSAIPPAGAEAPPSNDDSRSGPLRLQEFAATLEAAIPALRVTSGKVRAIGNAAGSSDAWAIAFGDGLIEKIDVHPPLVSGAPMPRFFALRPLYNHLVARSGVMIKPLNDDGTYGSEKATDFQGVDLDTLASNFLNDLDLFLSAPNASAAYRLASKAALQDILDTKALLALAVANGLDYVLDFKQPAPETLPPDWVAARDMLKQQMLVSLGRAWDTDIILQYDADTAVAKPWGAVHARLSGGAHFNDTPAGRDAKRVSLAGAKTSLMPNAPYVTFGATLQRDKTFDADVPPAEALQSFLALDLDYGFNEVEFDIAPVEAGYESSNWLSFVLPPTKTAIPPGWSVALGATRAPLPLRAYPSPAVLLAHSADASHPDTTDWRETVFWTYSFTYRHQSAAQDQIRVDVEFNRPPPIVTEPAVTDDLFAALAQYDAIRPKLWDILKQLPNLDKVTNHFPLDNAVQLFADLVRNRIRPLWAQHWKVPPMPAWASCASVHTPPPALPGVPANESYRYLTTLISEPSIDGNRYTALLLARKKDSGSMDWPVITVSDAAGNSYVLTKRLLSPTADDMLSQYYDFPAASVVPVGARLDYHMAFINLHVAQYENATTEVSVMRNARLLGPDGPQTRDGFIYLTPPVAFPDLATPGLTWDKRFTLDTWNQQGTALAQVFDAALDHDLSGNRQTALAVRYGFELATDVIVTALPVLFRPRFPYTSAEAPAIAQQVKTWRDNNRPATTGGEWLFDVTVYAALDAARQRPLLELKNLYSVIGD